MTLAAIVELRTTTGSQQGIAAAVLGIAVGALLLLAVIGGLASIFSRRWRRTGRRIAGLTVCTVVALFLVGRGVAEFWTVNYSDPASYDHSWGGPSLAGVFAVHSGPGFVLVIAATWWLIRRRARNRRKAFGGDEPSYPRTA